MMAASRYALVTALALMPLPAPAEEAGWLYYGGDQGGRHYSEAAQINRGNVSGLEVAWVHRSGDAERYGKELENSSAQATPVLLPPAAGGALVYCTPFNRVIALDPGTGEQRWEFDPGIDRRGDRPFRCRGVSYGADPEAEATAHCRHRLYLATHDRRLWAIDARDGTPCPGFGDGGRVAVRRRRPRVRGMSATPLPPCRQRRGRGGLHRHRLRARHHAARYRAWPSTA